MNNKIFLLVLLACWGLSSYATDPDNPCVETGYLGSWSDWSCTDGSVSITDPDPTEYLKCINDSFSLPSIEEEITDGSKTRTRTNTLTCPESSGYGAPTEETEDVPYQLDDEYWVDGDGTQVSDSITFTESGTYTYTPTVEISTSDSDCSSEPIEQTGSQITVYVPGFIPPSTICHNVDDDNDNTYADYSEGSSSVSGENDLQQITLENVPSGAQVSFTYTSEIQLWNSSTRGTKIESGSSVDASSEVWVEGLPIESEEETVDATISATFTYNSDSCTTEDETITVQKEGCCPTIEEGTVVELGVLSIAINESLDGETAADGYCKYTTSEAIFTMEVKHDSLVLGSYRVDDPENLSLEFEYNQAEDKYREVKIIFSPTDPDKYIGVRDIGYFKGRVKAINLTINPESESSLVYQIVDGSSVTFSAYLEEDKTVGKFTILHKAAEYQAGEEGEGGSIVFEEGAEPFEGSVTVGLKDVTSLATFNPNNIEWNFEGIQNVNIKFTRPAAEGAAEKDLLLLQGSFTAAGILCASATTVSDMGPWNAGGFKAMLNSGSTATLTYDITSTDLGIPAADINVTVFDMAGLTDAEGVDRKGEIKLSLSKGPNTWDCNSANDGSSTDWELEALLEESTIHAFGFKVGPGNAEGEGGEAQAADITATWNENWELSTVTGTNLSVVHDKFDSIDADIQLCEFEVKAGTESEGAKLTKFAFGDSTVNASLSNSVQLQIRILEATYNVEQYSCTDQSVIDEYFNIDENQETCQLTETSSENGDQSATKLSLTCGFEFQTTAETSSKAHIKFKDYNVLEDGSMQIGLIEAAFINDSINVGFKAEFTTNQFNGCFKGQFESFSKSQTDGDGFGVEGTILLGVEANYTYGLFDIEATAPGLDLYLPSPGGPIPTGTKLTSLRGSFGWNVKAQDLCSSSIDSPPAVGKNPGTYQIGLGFGIADKLDKIFTFKAYGLFEFGDEHPQIAVKSKLDVIGGTFVGDLNTTFDLANKQIKGNMGGELKLGEDGKYANIGGLLTVEEDGTKTVSEKAKLEFLLDFANNKWEIGKPGSTEGNCGGEGNAMQGLLLDELIQISAGTEENQEFKLSGNFTDSNAINGTMGINAIIDEKVKAAAPSDYSPYLKADAGVDCDDANDEHCTQEREGNILCQECSDETDSNWAGGVGALMIGKLNLDSNANVTITNGKPSGNFDVALDSEVLFAVDWSDLFGGLSERTIDITGKINCEIGFDTDLNKDYLRLKGTDLMVINPDGVKEPFDDFTKTFTF